jgi:release factor glutamine methyltransferase
MTIQQAIHYGEKLLQESGVERPRWNAEQLLLFSLKQDRSKIYTELNRVLTYLEQQSYQGLLRKRAEHFPLAYIEGTQDFYGRPFAVNQSVLIPRPETEEIIRAVLSLQLPKNPRIIDLGSGSGCIAATLAIEIPDANVVSLEISAAALPTLRKNIPSSVFVVRGDSFTLPFQNGKFDIVVSNPPYIESSTWMELPAETRWEPSMALLTTNLEETYRRLIQQSKRILKSAGHLIFEIGFGQSERLQALCEQESEMKLLQIRRDTNDIPRTFILKKTDRN